MIPLIQRISVKERAFMRCSGRELLELAMLKLMSEGQTFPEAVKAATVAANDTYSAMGEVSK